MLKAESILSIAEKLKPGKGITWPVYAGTDVMEKKTVEDYVNGFFLGGNLMPISGFNLGLDILSVQSEYDDAKASYSIVIEGVVKKLKGDN